MSPAEREIRQRILARGAIALAEFMSIALAGAHGYYVRGNPLGEGGDFVTAPEVSQMFGELIGLFLIDSWQRLGAPSPFQLIELGPGSGLLLQDALRAARIDPAFLAAKRLHLVEINADLREIQRTALPEHAPLWHDDLAALPAGPFLLIANEFLDALPIHQFEATAAGWRERVVVLAEDRLALSLAAPSAAFALIEERRRRATKPGAVIEVSPAALDLVTHLAARAVAAPGLALFIDYGPLRSSFGDSLQAVKSHHFYPPLEGVGEADLTAHVDFAALAAAARRQGARCFGPVTQGDFLRALGIEARAEILMREAAAAERRRLARQLRRLTHWSEMGDLFKVMAIASPQVAELAGL